MRDDRKARIGRKIVEALEVGLPAVGKLLDFQKTGTRGVLRIHAQIHGKITEAVEDRLAVDEFDALEDMGMMTKYRIGSRGDRGTSHLPLIVGDRGAHEVNSPMNGDAYDVGLLLGEADIRTQGGKICFVGKGQRARHGAWLIGLEGFVYRVRTQRCAAGAPFFGPISLRQDGRVGKHCELGPVGQSEQGRYPRLANISPGPDDNYACCLKVLNGLDERCRSKIQAMIPSAGNDVEAGPRHRSGSAGMCQHGMPRLRQARAVMRETRLQLTETHLRARKHRSRRGKAGVRIVSVRRNIAGSENQPRSGGSIGHGAILTSAGLNVSASISIKLQAHSGANRLNEGRVTESRHYPAADFDALAAETFDSTYELYEDLRRRCPVARAEAWNGFWAYLRHEDVRRAAADSATYITSVQNVIPKIAFTGRRPPLHLDPPEHTPYRKALNPLLSEEAVARLEQPIRAIAAELAAQLAARGAGDICADFSSHLTIRVFAHWMNLDTADAQRLSEVGRSYNIAVQSAHDSQVRDTSLELYEIARRLVLERQERPQDPTVDPVSALLAARVEGKPLPHEMLIGAVRQVLVVGIIAPTIVIGSIVVHLTRHPALQSTLRAEPSMWPAALEEFLRLYTPYRGFARTSTREVFLHDRIIRPGEPIALVYASANRDETVFPDASAFVMNRPNIHEHLAFGRGPHHCVGAALGRLELRVAMEELLAASDDIRLAGPVKTTRMPEIGALSVPVTVVRRSSGS